MAISESTDPTGVLEGHTTPQDTAEIPEEDAAKVSKFMEKFRDAASVRNPWDSQWELNHNVLRGSQFVIRNRVSGEVQYLTRDATGKLIAVNNVIRPTSRSLLGKLTKNIATWTVVPATDDLSDMQSSEVYDALLQYQRRRLRFDRLYIRWYKGVVQRGLGILKIFWDPQDGPKTPTCKVCGYVAGDLQTAAPDEEGAPCPHCMMQAQQQFDEQMAQFTQAQETTPPELLGGLLPPEPPGEAPKLEAVFEGDVSSQIVSPFDFYADESAESLEDCMWVCQRAALPVARIRSMFPDKAEHIVSEGLTQADRSDGIATSAIGINTANARLLKDHAYLYEFHEVPTGEHPDGRIVWICNNRILKEVDSPYWPLLKRFPFYIAYWEKEDGEFYGESWIEQAWHIQRELNNLRTQKREHREQTLAPKLMNPNGSGVPVDEITSKAGQNITFNPMVGPPRWQDPPQMPAYVQTEEENLTQSIRAQATISTHEAGIAPSDNSGRFAAILEAQSDQQVGPCLKFNATEFTAIGHGIATLCHAYYRDARTFTVYGDESAKTYTFKSARVGGYSDIIVAEDDALSSNKAVRIEQALNLKAQAPELFFDPKTGLPDAKAFAKYARLKIGHLGASQTSADRAEAAALPSKIEEYTQAQPGWMWTPQEAKSWDDPDVWSEELLSWLKKCGRNKPEEVVQNVLMAQQFYDQMSQGLRLQAQQQQAAMAGEAAPSISGGPSKPNPLAQGGQSASGKSTSALPEAGAVAQQADRAAEAASNPGTHEG